MSILKFANGKNRGKGALKEAIQYIINPEKMSNNLITGNGINLDTPCEDMETIQALLGKNTGRRYIHYIISFDENVSEEMAFIVAEEAATYFADEYQYVLAIHTNTNNCHAHVLINVVNIQTGNKFSQSKADMLKFRSYVNDCLLRHGLNLIGESAGTELSCKTRGLQEWEEWKDLFEDDEIDDDSNLNSFFGFADPEEVSQIQCAQSWDKNMRDIIRFFQGEAEELPPDIYYDDAEMLYQQWCDSLRMLEED